MINEIEKLLEDLIPHHSDFQIDNFIIGKQGDSWSRYKQALMELAARVESIEELRITIEIDKIALKKLKKRWCWRQDSRNLRRLEVLRVECRIKQSLSKMSHSEAEMRRFLGIAKNLKAILGDIDSKKRRVLEAESWANKAKRMARIDLMSVGYVQRQTIEFVMSLPDEMQQPVIQEIEFQKNVVQNLVAR